MLVFGDDLRFEDEHGLCSSAVVNRWACELPTNGCPAANSWPSYVGAVSQWSEFGEERAVGLLDSRERLKALLSAYAVYRSQGPAGGGKPAGLPARRRQPKSHVTVMYLEDEFADLFQKGLARVWRA